MTGFSLNGSENPGWHPASPFSWPRRPTFDSFIRRAANGPRHSNKNRFGIDRSSKAMSRQKRMCVLALAFILLLSGSPAALAQQKDKNKSNGQDVPDRERNVKTEKSNMFKRWINEDVAYIITDDEKRAWKKLQTDEEREQF